MLRKSSGSRRSGIRRNEEKDPRAIRATMRSIRRFMFIQEISGREILVAGACQAEKIVGAGPLVTPSTPLSPHQRNSEPHADIATSAIVIRRGDMERDRGWHVEHLARVMIAVCHDANH